MELNVQVPTWKVAKLNLTLGPIKDTINAAVAFLEAGKTLNQAGNALVQNVFDAAKQTYNNLKQEEAKIHQDFVNAVNNATADLNSTGFKLIMRSPFVGDINTLRRELINTHTQLYSNAPQTSSAAIVTSVTLVVSAGIEEDAISFLTKIANMVTIFTQAEVLTNMFTAFQAPALDPIGKILLSNNEWVKKTKQYYDDYQKAMGSGISSNDSLAVLNSLSPSLSEIDPEGAAALAGLVSNKGFMSIASGGPAAIAGALVESTWDGVKNIFTEASLEITKGVSDIFTTSPLSPAMPLTAGKSFLVVENDASPDTFKVIYPSGTYNPDLIQDGFISATTLNIPLSNVYTNGDIFYVMDPNAATSKFPLNIYPNLDATKYEILGLGTGNVVEYSSVFTTNTDFLEPVKELLSSNPYDKWYDIFNVADVTGGLTTKLAQSTLLTANSLFKAADSIGSGINNVITWSSQFVQASSNQTDSTIDNISSFLQKFTEDVDAGGFSLFIIPPDTGGLDRIRFIISQWVQSGVEGTPTFSEGTVFMPITIVGVGPPLLDLLGKLFAEP